MDFKFLNDNHYLILSPTGNQYLRFYNNTLRHENNEYCLQFDDDEPLVFAQGNSELTITINPTNDGSIIFTHNGKRFKLFAREAQI